MDTLLWIGFAASIFAGSVIISKPNRSHADRILAIWLFLLALDFLMRVIEFAVYGQPLLSNSFLLFNPLFFLYIKSLTNQSFKFRYTQLFHLLPFISFQVLVYIYGSKLSLRAFIANEVNMVLFFLFTITSFTSWTLYITWSIIMLRKHKRRLVNELSTITRNHRLGWLYFITIFYMAYCIITLLMGANFFIFKLDSLTLVIFVSAVSLFMVYAFGYYGLLQNQIYPPLNELKKSQIENNPSIAVEKIDKVKLLILEYFEKDKPFLDPDFNMEMFAANIGVPKYELTIILNKVLGKNFFQFVNSYRIEEVKKCLLDKKNLFSIEAIGYDCGFNSKSSFFTIFKKMTGQTPSQYRNSHLS